MVAAEDTAADVTEGGDSIVAVGAVGGAYAGAGIADAGTGAGGGADGAGGTGDRRLSADWRYQAQ
jgi:hypothetical protein